MPSLNRVLLIGVIAGHKSEALIVAMRDDAGDRTTRVAVAVPPELIGMASSLRIGRQVVVEGSARRGSGPGFPTAVLASDVWVVGDERAEPAVTLHHAPTSTHASPTAHARRGHWRRVGRGRPNEGLVWVRATQVRGRAATDRLSGARSTGQAPPTGLDAMAGHAARTPVPATT